MNYKKITIISLLLSLLLLIFILKDVRKITLKSQKNNTNVSKLDLSSNNVNEIKDNPINSAQIEEKEFEEKESEENLDDDYMSEIRYIFTEYESIVNKSYQEGSDKILLNGDVFLLKEKALEFSVPEKHKEFHLNLILLMSNNEKNVADIKIELNKIKENYPWIRGF